MYIRLEYKLNKLIYKVVVRESLPPHYPLFSPQFLFYIYIFFLMSVSLSLYIVLHFFVDLLCQINLPLEKKKEKKKDDFHVLDL